jgi:hypothetical protein
VAGLALVLGGCGTSGGGSEAGAAPAADTAVDTPSSDGSVTEDARTSASCDLGSGPCLDTFQEAGVVPDAPADAPISPDTAALPDGPRPDLGAISSRKLDILFMVDNSPSMAEEQNNLRRNFPVFMNELKKIPGGLPDVHIGVVSSDLGAGSQPLTNGGCPRPGGDRGILQTKPTCGLDGNSVFLASANNGTTNNFVGSLETAFSCMAALGTQGCGYEHQLQATRVALYQAVTPENRGFLRDDALLAIILISDEDDCSAETTSNLFVDDASFPMTTASFRCSQVGHLCNGVSPPIAPFDAPLESCRENPAGRLIKVSEIVDSIRALKRNPAEQIMVAGIFGWPQNPLGARYRYQQTNQGIDVAPICQSSNGTAAVGLRLKTFVESFGSLGSFYSICNDDYSPALQQIGQAVSTRF